MKKLNIILLLFLVIESTAQIKLPSIELQVKGGFTIYEGEQTILNLQYEPTTYTANTIALAGNVDVNQYLALGFFYNRSLNGVNSFDNYNEDDVISIGENEELLPEPYEVDHLLYGIKFRLSLNRTVRLRPFIHGSYYYREMTTTVREFGIGHRNSGLSAGLGLMIKMNSRLYMTIPEFTIFPTKENPIFILNSPDGQGGNPMIITEFGISYYIHNKR